jgi:DNA-binding MarR family transcriptional regulator
MSNDNEGPPERQAHDEVQTDFRSDFVLIAEGRPPSRIALARERMLISRLYVGLLQSITDDYGAAFVAQSDSLAYRTIGIYVFLRTVLAHALRLPRAAVLRRLQELVKHGYVERVGNAYRITDKVNIPDLQNKLQRRINMVMETATKLAKIGETKGAIGH